MEIQHSPYHREIIAGQTAPVEPEVKVEAPATVEAPAPVEPEVKVEAPELDADQDRAGDRGLRVEVVESGPHADFAVEP